MLFSNPQFMFTGLVYILLHTWLSSAMRDVEYAFLTLSLQSSLWFSEPVQDGTSSPLLPGGGHPRLHD